MTTVSKPNRKPARAAVSDQKKMRAFIWVFAESRRYREDISIQKVVAEFSLGIVSPAQLNKVGQFLVAGTELLRTDREQLTPVWPDIARCPFSLDHPYQLNYRTRILLTHEWGGQA